MANNKEINQELQSLSTFQLLVDTYEEIAAVRMRRIHVSVVRSRDFIMQLAGILEELKAQYKHQVRQLLQQRKHTSPGTLRTHNGKTIALLLSANTGLYGSILQSTVMPFIEYVNQHECDAAIVGRYGKTAFENHNPDKAFTFFDFPDQRFRPEDMQYILSKILNYSSIYVFHGKFISIVKQEPTMTMISTEQTTREAYAKSLPGTPLPAEKFIFEPSLEKILIFFEEEIFASLFEQAIHESELAKFASRMVTLDKASQNIRDRVKKVEFMKRLTKHQIMNKKQQDSLSSILLWGK